MDKKIILFTSPSCGKCKVLKNYMQENNIAYEQKNVLTTEIMDELTKRNFQGIPVVRFNGEYFQHNNLDVMKQWVLHCFTHGTIPSLDHTGTHLI